MMGALVAGCARGGEKKAMMTEEDTRQAARRFYETLNQAMRTGEMGLLDVILARNVVDHDPTPGMGPGREGIKHAFAEFRVKFPDYRAALDDLIVEGAKPA